MREVYDYFSGVVCEHLSQLYIASFGNGSGIGDELFNAVKEVVHYHCHALLDDCTNLFAIECVMAEVYHKVYIEACDVATVLQFASGEYFNITGQGRQLLATGK